MAAIKFLDSNKIKLLNLSLDAVNRIAENERFRGFHVELAPVTLLNELIEAGILKDQTQRALAKPLTHRAFLEEIRVGKPVSHLVRVGLSCDWLATDVFREVFSKSRKRI